MRIARATRRHVPAIADLMAASPLLKRYRVTRAGASRSLADAVRARDLLLVAEQEQSHGLGAALLTRAEREVRAAGARHLALLVTRTNRRARSFYERHGYARVGNLPGFARAGIDESLYVKSWMRR